MCLTSARSFSRNLKNFPVSIAKEDRLSYFETLEEYAVNRNINPFAEMIAALEEIADSDDDSDSR